MKNRKWMGPALIVVCLVVFFGYRMLDRMRTDTVAPKFHMEENAPQVSVSDMETALLQGVTATDDRDGDVTDSVLIESIKIVDADGMVTVAYAAFDRSGNVAKAERQVLLTDYTSPRFSLSAPLIFRQNQAVDLQSRISAQDVFDGDITHRIRATNLSGTTISDQGSYEVEFRVSNSLGDTVILQLPVESIASGAYDGTLSLSDYLVYVPAGSEFAPESYLTTYAVAGTSVDLSSGIPEDYSLEISGHVDTDTPGVYDITYKVTYTAQEVRGYTGYTRLIVVVEG